MKKFKVDFSWRASMRGYSSVIIVAENEEDAKEMIWDEADIDYNKYMKIIDNDFEVDEIKEIRCENES